MILDEGLHEGGEADILEEDEEDELGGDVPPEHLQVLRVLDLGLLHHGDEEGDELALEGRIAELRAVLARVLAGLAQACKESVKCDEGRNRLSLSARELIRTWVIGSVGWSRGTSSKIASVFSNSCIGCCSLCLSLDGRPERTF